MICALIYGMSKTEEEILEQLLRELTAKYTEETARISMAKRKEDIEDILKMGILQDLALLHVETENGLDAAIRIREYSETTEIILFVGKESSPFLYIRPEIRASALLLYPFRESWSQGIQEVFQVHLMRKGKRRAEDVLWIGNRGDSIWIPVHKIRYIEARRKKIVIHTENSEYETYGTMKAMQKEYSEHFCQCHRSILVNKQHIKAVNYISRVLTLHDDVILPISRTYIDNVRKIRKGKT